MSNSFLTKIFISFANLKRNNKNTLWSHKPPKKKNIIANNLLAQQYTKKLMLEICNVRNTFFLLRLTSFLFVCFLLDMI